MRKISSIIPTNNRISTVDMQKTSPVRRGVPSFGRNVVSPSNHRELPKTTLDEATWTYNQYNDSKEKMRVQSGMAEKIGQDFFEVRKPEIDAMTSVEVEPSELSMSSVEAEPMAPQAGRRLDVVA